MPRVLIIGATGNVGSLLLEQLLALPSPPTVRVSSRDPSKATFPPSVEVVQGDVSDATTWPGMFASVDRVFLYAVYGKQSAELMQAMKAGGVSYVVLLSAKWRTTEPDHPFARMVAPWEDAVQAAGLSYTFIRAAGFSTNTFMQWVGEINATGRLSLPYPDSQSAPVAAEDMAAVALTALTSERLRDAAPVLTGPVSLTQTQQVEALNRVRAKAGLKPIELRKVSPEEWKAAMVAHMPPFLCDALLMTWKKAVGQPEAIDCSEPLTGLPSLSYDAWVDKYEAELCK